LRRTHLSTVVALSATLLLALSAQALASGITNSGDDLRDGWYPSDGVTQQLVSNGQWGQLWSTQLPAEGGQSGGQVYAQPLYDASAARLVVATENDNIYGLDPASGSTVWGFNNGTPFDPTKISCLDINPSIGTTSTPVIDTSTNTAYYTFKVAVGASGAQWYMDARDVTTGARVPGWPVAINGPASNSPNVQFSQVDQQQRPGLLLMDGVVYAAFGSHCDYSKWQGWVFGVSTTSHSIVSSWVDNTGPTSDGAGAGIWQSGVGLMSNGSGQIYFVTGNGDSPTLISNGTNPLPLTFGDAAVHLQVQGTSLQPVDYFEPFDAPLLDAQDADFGSGGIVGLQPQYFGQGTSTPNLGVAVGKEGYVYLLNLDRLGGYQEGASGGDDVVQRLGPRGGVWGRAGVWPGDGGYVYITTTSGLNNGGPLDAYKYGLTGQNQPSLTLAGSTSDAFGWGSGPAVVTSSGANDGSAVVWTIWSANRQGGGAQLRAYNPIPVNGTLQEIWSTSIGTATNYAAPGVGDNQVYVGTRGGAVIAYGSPTAQKLTSPGVSFGTTSIGSSTQGTLTVTATAAVTVDSVSSSSGQFSLGSFSPVTLTPGQTTTIPVTFSPTQTGPVAGQATATLDDGSQFSFPLAGTGQASTAQVAVGPGLLSLGATSINSALTGSATIDDVGGTPLVIDGFTLPQAPFSVTGIPNTPYTIQPGGSITVNFQFQSSQIGQFSDALGITTSAPGTHSIVLSASAGTPGNLVFSSQALAFGSVPIGTTATQSFTITNTGGTSVTINKSKPPSGGAFTATTSLPEGLTIAPSQQVVEQVSFTPTSLGAATGTWPITGDDDTGIHPIQFTGTGTGVAAGVAATPTGPAGATGSPPAHATSVTLSALQAVPAIAVAGKLRSAYITFAASAAGTTRFILQRVLPGRKVDGRCVAATAANDRRQGCTRYVTVATFVHTDVAGANRIRITRFVAARKLTNGRYRLRAIPSAAGIVGPASETHFRVSATAPARHSRRRAGLWLIFSRLDWLNLP